MCRIAMISMHTCPLACPQALLGGRETGGMNVYVRELSRELGRRGKSVDVFTRFQDTETDQIQEAWLRCPRDLPSRGAHGLI